MARITIPDDQNPVAHVWATKATALTSVGARMSDAIYNRSLLSLREFEGARIRIAEINDCAICRAWRSARDVPGRAESPDEIPEEFYEHVLDPSWEGYSERERLAIEYAERFAIDHLSMDDAFWDRMHANYSDDEIVDLTLCVGWLIASGRLNRVLEIDQACAVPLLMGDAAASTATS
jgi:alkylhydroperoxidase family enzyme